MRFFKKLFLSILLGKGVPITISSNFIHIESSINDFSENWYIKDKTLSVLVLGYLLKSEMKASRPGAFNDILA